LTIARGSCDAVATYATYSLTPALNILVGSFAPSLASLDRVRTHGGRLWTLAVSQSRQTPDLVKFQAAFAKADGAASVLDQKFASFLTLSSYRQKPVSTAEVGPGFRRGDEHLMLSQDTS
jgi:glucosamine--fructose-6-phosphate aminotransferase (isomerizing)